MFTQFHFTKNVLTNFNTTLELNIPNVTLIYSFVLASFLAWWRFTDKLLQLLITIGSRPLSSLQRWCTISEGNAVKFRAWLICFPFRVDQRLSRGFPDEPPLAGQVTCTDPVVGFFPQRARGWLWWSRHSFLNLTLLLSAGNDRRLHPDSVAELDRTDPICLTKLNYVVDKECMIHLKFQPTSFWITTYSFGSGFCAQTRRQPKPNSKNTVLNMFCSEWLTAD